MTEVIKLYEEWHSFLEKIINSDSFEEQMRLNGFYLSEEAASFKDLSRKIMGKAFGINTANLLSKDFWHYQNEILIDRRCYLIRTGKGSFAIFDEKQFPRPYLDLNIENSTEIDIEEPRGFDNLKRAFNENILENSALEQLNFNNVYNKIIERILGKQEKYFVGIRGNTTIKFDIYLDKINSTGPIKIREYNGQAELDYTLWTRDSVFLFEAKQVKEDAKYYLDIGWHKFAYAAIRFQKYLDLNIIPIYFLRTIEKTYLFVFPKIRFYRDGIVLNDKMQMTPNHTFSVSYNNN